MHVQVSECRGRGGEGTWWRWRRGGGCGGAAKGCCGGDGELHAEEKQRWREHLREERDECNEVEGARGSPKR
ncbi:hypothetical protein AAC387_Pa12g1160 [Persea americana]